MRTHSGTPPAIRVHRALIFAILIAFCKSDDDNVSPEALHRKTVKDWRSQRSWTPWNHYTKELLDRFENSNGNQNQTQNRIRLEIVGAFEEGILAIEKATVARGEGEDPQRDAALSRLYAAYGKTLLELDSVECRELALDPHTLLIGAETVSRSSGDDEPPSTRLCIENSENALRNAVTLDATNSQAGQLLEKITGMDSAHKRKPKEFVAELFDSFADTFDEKLLGNLGYRVPQLVGDAAKRLRSSSYGYYRAVLDAGCGTGLAGRVLKPLVADVMIGVDASRKMLDIAAKCTTTSGCGLKGSEKDMDNGDGDGDGDGEALYDDLLVMDLEEITLGNTLHRMSHEDISGFDLIVAADVLVYFGSITKLLKTFASVSTPGAVLVFSCERATDEEAPLGWRLLSSGRFSHTKLHAVEAASEAGYELVSYEEIVPRMEKGEEVRGHLFGFVLKREGLAHVEL